MLDGLLYEEETHTYYWCGVKVPSVTEIAKPISSERLNELPKWVVENARKRGKAVHEYAEEYLLCGELDFDRIEPEYLPYVENFVNWARTYKPKVLYTEFCMGCEEFAGTTDLICEIDDYITIVDYKTSSAVDKKSLSVQLDGYDRLAKKYGIFAKKFMYLHLKKDGYVFKEIKTDPAWFDLLLLHNKKMKEKVEWQSK
jgi:hypothetical protein